MGGCPTTVADLVLGSGVATWCLRPNGVVAVAGSARRFVCSFSAVVLMGSLVPAVPAWAVPAGPVGEPPDVRVWRSTPVGQVPVRASEFAPMVPAEVAGRRLVRWCAIMTPLPAQ